MIRAVAIWHITSNLRNKYTTFVYIKLITFVYYFLI